MSAPVLLSASGYAGINASEQATDGRLTGPESLTNTSVWGYANGTVAGCCQHVVSDVISVASGAGTTLDLTAIAGSGGGNRNFTSIQEFLIENMDSQISVTVGPGASNGWNGINGTTTGSIPLESGTIDPYNVNPFVNGAYMRRSSPSNGLAVGAGNSTIKLVAASATAKVRYTFLGRGS